MKYCNKCGNEVRYNDAFCNECGSKIKSKNIDKDKPIKADLKIEITNATTEKAFKKVGETVDSGKKVVKVTTGIVKRIFIPALVLFIIAIVIAFIYEQQEKERRAALWKKTSKITQERYLKAEQNSLIEEKNCVIQEYRDISKSFSNVKLNLDVWQFVQTKCNLTYTEVKKYKNTLGVNLEKL